MSLVDSSLPQGYQLTIRLKDSAVYEAVAKTVKSGLSGGSCREYLGRGKTPEVALAAVLRLLRCPMAKEKTDGFFPFIRACATLLGIQDTPDEAPLVEDPSWYGCFDDGLTPEEAVAEFKANRPWDESKVLAASLLKGALPVSD
jgi:hypothetical protein